MIRALRSALGVLLGMILLSTVVELVEFGVVSAVNGRPTTDPDAYYAIRNRPAFLGLKLVYNTLAAVAGGLVAALVAGHSYREHGIALASVQAVAFGWALTRPELSRNMPAWMWAALIVLSAAGAVWGAQLQARRHARLLQRKPESS